jgi:hypothetical protein
MRRLSVPSTDYNWCESWASSPGPSDRIVCDLIQLSIQKVQKPFDLIWFWFDSIFNSKGTETFWFDFILIWSNLQFDSIESLLWSAENFLQLWNWSIFKRGPPSGCQKPPAKSLVITFRDIFYFLLSSFKICLLQNLLQIKLNCIKKKQKKKKNWFDLHTIQFDLN